MRRLAGVVVFAAGACGAHAVAPGAPPAAGIAIALYAEGKSSYSVVDDRRWVEVTGSELVLEHVDPGAALASLVIEPYGGPARLRIGACVRDRFILGPVAASPPQPPSAVRAQLPPRHVLARPPVVPQVRSEPEGGRASDVVRCAVAGAPGKALVRIVYVSTSLGFHGEHEITMTAPDRAQVRTTLAIATPAWHERAGVTLFAGLPGGDQPPREVAHGTIALDGTTAIVDVGAREVPAQLRRVFDGAQLTKDLSASDPAWGRESRPQIWVWLELSRLRLAPGPIHVHLAIAGDAVRDVDVAEHETPEAAAAPLRLPLWIDDALHGMRQRYWDPPGGSELAERFLLSVANIGDTAREVWIEEHLRPAHRRQIERAWPGPPATAGGLARSKVVVRPGKIERVGYTITYDF